MPRYEVEGYGKKTGRKRKRVYEGADVDDAINRAAADGTLVEAITRRPDVPATDAQVSYARSLGLVFTADVSKAAISAMIDERLEAGEPDILAILAEAAESLRVARITYWKDGEPEASVRMVEPYTIMGRRGEAQVVRCWQVFPLPDDGDHWRTFTIRKIRSAAVTEAVYAPRISATICDGVVEPIGGDPKGAKGKAGCAAGLLPAAGVGLVIVALSGVKAWQI